jgi:hypothetical protein
MSIAAYFIALALAGQVNSGNNRYPITGNTAAAASPANAGQPNANAADSGLIPKIGDSPAEARGNASPPPAAKSGAAASPFDRGAASPAASAPPTTPLGGNSVSPPPAASGAQSPYRTQGSRLNAAQSATAPASAGIKPTAMMQQMMKAPPGSQLTGTPISLMEVVGGARSRQDQAQRIEAYWDLCSSVADYNLGVREQGELAQLRQLMPRAGAVMQQVEQKFAVRLSTSKQAAVASQRRLASLIGRSGSSPLPLDPPHCGSYESEYERIFGNRPSAEAQDLATLLPLRYAELKDAATGITSAQEWATNVARGDNGDGTETARALELLALRRRAFVQIARDYNRRIARYAEISTPGEIGADRLVAMLIRTDTAPTATRPMLPNGAINRQGSDATLPPRTFAGDAQGWESAGANGAEAKMRDEWVRPAAGEGVRDTSAHKERSLLVSPR